MRGRSGTSDPQRKEFVNDAIGALTRAVANDYRDVAYLQLEADFDPLRNLPEFQLRIEQLRSAVKATVAGEQSTT